MGIRHEWIDSSQQVLLFRVEFPWTWQEYRELTEKLLDEIRGIGHPVATIVEVHNMGKLPPRNLLNELQYVESHMPANIFASVIVGAPYVVTSFMTILMRLRPRAKAISLFSKSVDEAKTLIQVRRQEVFQASSR